MVAAASRGVRHLGIESARKACCTSRISAAGAMIGCGDRVVAGDRDQARPQIDEA